MNNKHEHFIVWKYKEFNINKIQFTVDTYFYEPFLSNLCFYKVANGTECTRYDVTVPI